MPPPPNIISSASASSSLAGLGANSAVDSDANSPRDPTPDPGHRAGNTGEPHPGSHWLGRADLFLRVIVRLYVGLILIFLPWTRVWAFNRFFLYYAHVSRLMESGAVRGVVSGLGLLNLWIAISEAMHYKEG
jgi:hypothetical protein